MKELDDFTVERLEKIANLQPAKVYNGRSYYPAAISELSSAEIVSLARIALAAKTAEPVAITDKSEITNLTEPGWVGNFLEPNFKGVDKGDEVYLYTAPVLNSPELPDGWKMVPIDLINDLRNAAHFEKASYAASFGSHIDTGRWKDEYEQLTATCKAVDELLAPPTTEK